MFNIYREIINFIKEKGYINPDEISKKFHIDDPALILDQMVELGYLQYGSSSCVNKACSYCILKNSCPYRYSGLKYYKIKV